jgi:hypothetical protein
LTTDSVCGGGPGTHLEHIVPEIVRLQFEEVHFGVQLQPDLLKAVVDADQSAEAEDHREAAEADCTGRQMVD